jgi:hypothetical protein
MVHAFPEQPRHKVHGGGIDDRLITGVADRKTACSVKKAAETGTGPGSAVESVMDAGEDLPDVAAPIGPVEISSPAHRVYSRSLPFEFRLFGGVPMSFG